MKKSNRGLWIFGFLCVMVSGIVLSNSKSRAKTVIYPTVASGEQVKESNNCVIDYSNTADGYVMVKFKKALGPTLKCVVTTGGQALNDGYKYTLSVNKYQVIPLTEGNTAYTIYLLYEVGGRYAMEMTLKVNVEMTDQFEPYLRPNQFVNYTKSTKVVKKAASITKKCKNDLAKVKKVYNYVIKNYKYDKKLAKTVKPGYVPNLNKIYKKKKGICFDYAALMSAMLRSQRIPTKLEVGYSGDVYHAWISCYVDEIGWVDNIIEFDGKNWSIMDPTLAANNSASDVKKYVGNGKNYVTKYTY